MGELVPLRPRPWPVTPYGPFRLRDDGRLERFRTQGERVIRWIEANCVLSDDRWVGQPFVLLPWQRQLLLDMFEEVWDARLGRWRRRYRTVYIGLPKKNGKTELVAALALYFLLGADEPSPKVVCAAASDDQADLIFKAASTMLTYGEAPLRELVDSRQVEVFARTITMPAVANAEIRRIAAKGGKFDGARLLMGACDELHEWQSENQRKMWGMISGAFATREEPLHIAITTAGEDDGEQQEDAVAPWLRMYRYGRRIEAGEIEDPSFFFRWWMALEDADPFDIAVLSDQRVNPSFGVTVGEDFYRAEFGKRTASEMRRYYCNQPVETINEWLEPGVWEACDAGTWEPIAGEPVFVAWDASSRRDSTAVVFGQWQQIEGRRRLRVSTRVWERPLRLDGYDPNWRVPKGEVLQHVRDLARRYDVRSVAYDPYLIAWVVEDLEGEGLPMVEWPQTDQRMFPATQRLFELIVDGDLAHDGDPVLTRHIKAARVKGNARAGQRLVKSQTGRKIDAAIALVMLAGEASAEPPAPSGVSVYVPD